MPYDRNPQWKPGDGGGTLITAVALEIIENGIVQADITNPSSDAALFLGEREDAVLAEAAAGARGLYARAAYESPLSYGAVGDGVSNEAAAISAAIAAAPAGGIVDLGGLLLRIATTITVGKKLTLRNGAIIAGAHRALLVTAADVTFENLSITRAATTPNASDTLADRSSVVVQGARFTSSKCTYTDANHACLYIVHGQGNGALIEGNRFANSSARQNACAVYVAAGTGRNRDIVIRGNTVAHTGSPDGILVYDSNACTIASNTVRNLRSLPEVTLTAWEVVSGTVYRAPERTDGNTRVIMWNGTELTENVAAPTAPVLNSWGISGGFVYLNVGADPAGGVAVSRIVSGYALLFYSTTNSTEGMCDNLVALNVIQDVDGFGIYLQLDRADALRNGTLGNRLLNVCLKGEQSNKLPFSGIGVIGGNETTLTGDTIRNVGTTAKPAPGFRINPPNATGTCTGTVNGMTVTGATKSGILLHSGTWIYNACRSNGNATNGFETFRASNGQIIDATLNACEAIGNGLSGVGVDNTGYPGAVYRVSVVGGLFKGNAGRGIIIRGGQDCKVVAATLGPNGSGLAQVQVDGSAARVLVADNVIPAGSIGVSIDASVVDATVSDNQISGLVTTPLSLAAPVRVGGAGGVASDYIGTGVPEGVLAARVGSRYSRLDGSAGAAFYVKETGTGNTGWAAK
jgi:hypothetical protein